MDIAQGLDHVFVFACIALFAYASGAAILPFLLARSCLRLRPGAREVRITGLDPGAGFYPGLVVLPLGGLGFFWGARAGWGGVLVALALWLSFSVRVRVTPEGTRVRRCVAFVVPWWGWCTPGRPTAYVDGWGDIMDPEALHLAGADGRWDLELAWGDAGSGDRADELAAAINAAVTALPE